MKISFDMTSLELRLIETMFNQIKLKSASSVTKLGHRINY